MDTQKRKRWWLPLEITGIVAVAVVAYFLSCQNPGMFLPSDKISDDARSDFQLMAEAWNSIHTHYVDRSAIKPRPLTYGAISGMVDALGDTGHSTFLSPQMIKEEEEFTAGEYKGIGAEVRMKAGHVVIVTPLDGSPAQKAGLQPGQIIIAVDGKDITGLSLFQVVKRISGPAGTKVTLKILDPGTGQTHEVTLARAAIKKNDITWHWLPGTRIAHLRIAGFNQGAAKDLKQALKPIKTDGLKGLILDLRNNPGGLLAEAVSAASQFLSGGNVLLEKNVKGQITDVSVEKGGLARHIPVVCLVNGGTASGAEIVAGALQDHRRAELVGTTTFGTGTVLENFPLSDGSALLLAVREWLTPDGHTIWHKGITPDLMISLPPGVSPVFPEEERNMTPQQLKDSKDAQLLKAMDLVGKQIG
jgi:carboxyl-terminal processing protease